jgi:hypothetical protein
LRNGRNTKKIGAKSAFKEDKEFSTILFILYKLMVTKLKAEWSLTPTPNDSKGEKLPLGDISISGLDILY